MGRITDGNTSDGRYEELARDEERYRLANEATHDVIWDWDLETGTVVWNDAIEATFGYRREDVPRDVAWWSDHVHPDDRERVVRGIHAAIDDPGRRAWTDEYRFLARDGGWRTVLDRGLVARDASGRGVRMIGSMLDLAERKRAEAAVRESEARAQDRYAELEQIYRYAPVGLFTFDRGYRFRRVNERMVEINGFPPEAHLGRSMYEIVPDLAPFLKEVYRPVLERGEPVLGVEVHGATPRAPDVARDWLCSYFPLTSGSGEVIGLIGAVLEAVLSGERGA